MIGSKYQELAMVTKNHEASEKLSERLHSMKYDVNKDYGGIINGCLGLSGETGEFIDMVKKWIFHDKEFNIEHAKKELGDVCWYIAMICDGFGWNLDEIMEMNIKKLRERYPQGFDIYMSNNRREGDI